MPDVETAMAAVAIGTQVAGTIFGGKAEKAAAKKQMRALKKQAEAARDQSLYQSRVATLNKEILLGSIKNVDKAEANTLRQTQEKLYKTTEAQNIAFAASGFSQSSGTLDAIKEESARQNRLDVLAIRDSFSTGRWNIRAKAQQFDAEADRFLEQAIRLDPVNNDYGINNSLFNANMATSLGNIGMGAVNYFDF